MGAARPEQITLGKRKRYSPDPGDEWLEVGKIGPEHVDRVFEGRAENGHGYLGRVTDADHYLLQGVVGIRFEGAKLGLFGKPDMQILLKPIGTVVPDGPDPSGATS